MNLTPHLAQNDSLTRTERRRSAIDARTNRHIGYQIAQTCRKMAQCIFVWGKQQGTMRMGDSEEAPSPAGAACFALRTLSCGNWLDPNN